MVHKEKASLWRLKHLLTRLSGDHTWIPCEVLEQDDDVAFFGDGRLLHKDHHVQPSSNGLTHPVRAGSILDPPNATTESGITQPHQISVNENVLDHTNGMVDEDQVVADITEEQPPSVRNNMKHTSMAGAAVETPSTSLVTLTGTNVVEDPVHNEGEHQRSSSMDLRTTDHDARQSGAHDSDETTVKPSIEDLAARVGMDIHEDGEMDRGVEQPAPRRMRTRAQAQAISDNTVNSQSRSYSPDSDNATYIHPLFLAPVSSMPDRNFGLPNPDADEVRKLLQLYIQKQEEVCRGAQKLYEGLLRADRLRKTVMKWAKADGHSGENRDMSDGEDWYDKEEWDLEEDLKKGQDEEEEDAATTAKKTRTRRQ